MEAPVEQDISKYDMETDISQLEAPTFTTIDRSNPASMLALDWDHKVNLVGKKVLNPMIHCCDKCLKPILIYGRMIPCKHVFCLGCAKQEESTCPRCSDKVIRVEQAGLGNIFLCTIGGSRYGNNGCRRTYLSSRDLQAHITHRHSTKTTGEKSEKSKADDSLRNVVNSISKASLASVVAAVNNAASTYTQSGYAVTPTSSYSGVPGQVDSHGMNISVLNSRPSNLITIHAQEPAAAAGTPAAYPGYPAGSYPNYAAGSNPAVTYPNLSQPPPAFGYTGAYATPTNPTHTQYPTTQYSGTQQTAQGYTTPYTAAAGYTSTTGQAQGYTSTHGAAAGQAGAYPTAAGQAAAGYAAATQYGAAPAAANHQGQWARPPPNSQQGYYRR